ncbi:hypothetical protein [Flaviaesturariibacter aridisoli]|uniref:Outer membrane protein beta-barrel domain-containing protein n=1 Tax=Flaviaesturariibacter aridisoli TaxID=2545761 RepID=A0A4V2WMS5_9BACT|nr:hypothetical protein [Flaviaesturariibacter aridisoli]TCZ72782.1 hypothetical protein E0486_08350 [Flaviaesturariibacter aridisoli]
MSKRPFEETDQHWSDVPLPDADAAWKDMNALLDKDERDRKGPPLLPAFLSGCTGWALLLLVLAGSAVGIYWRQLFPAREQGVTHAATPSSTGNQAQPIATRPEREADGDPNGTAVAPPPGPARANGPNHTASTPAAATPPEQAAGSRRTDVPVPAGKPSTHGSDAVATIPNPAGNAGGSTKPRTQFPDPAPTHGSGTARRNNRNRTLPVAHTGTPQKPRVRRSDNSTAGSGGVQYPLAGARKDTSGAATAVDPARKPGLRPTVTDSAFLATNSELKRRRYQEPGSIVPASALQAPDSAAKTATLTPTATGDSALAAVAAEAAKKKARRAPWFSAGVGISQAVPIGGQQGSGANYRGRFNPLSEHVPALWLRAQQGRWFLQGEARFNAPQLVPAFAFSQKTRWDTGAHAVQTDRQQLRKAWYHQFPLTLNYNVLPRWSIGAGAQWSVLYRAAGDRITLRRDISSTQTSESRMPFQVPGYRDSFLYRSQWQLVLQTEVGWRRWGLGLRYRSDLQPFLRYTQPDGTVSDVSNEAFEATLRFRVWQSKKRK